MATIISPRATGTEQDAAAAALPVGTLLRYSFVYDGVTVYATGTVVKAEGSMVHVTVVSHDSDPFLVGKAMGWSVCWCERV